MVKKRSASRPAAPVPVLEISGLKVRRGGVEILRGVDWRVEPGQHWAVLGPNGSGKTSLLSALTGYLTPTDGSISLLGERYGESDWRDLRHKLGIVSSSVRRMMPDPEPALETVVSGRYAMIDLWVKLTDADRDEGRALLRRIECEHLADRPWAFLSQGERQRVLIGRALMARPRLLVLDEPCAGLDPAAREHFLQFLQRLSARRDAPTLVLVTHHVEEIMPCFTHALLLRDGANLASGRVSAVLNSGNLSTTFASPIRLKRAGGRFSLSVNASRRVL